MEIKKITTILLSLALITMFLLSIYITNNKDYSKKIACYDKYGSKIKGLECESSDSRENDIMEIIISTLIFGTLMKFLIDNVYKYEYELERWNKRDKNRW